MKILAYRRPTLTDAEGCPPRPAPAALALACHKGNASQAQTSTQTGAQDQGVVNQGSGNETNTGTKIEDIFSTTNGQNVKTGANSVVNLSDQGAIKAATDLLNSVLSEASAGAQKTIEDVINQASQISSSAQDTLRGSLDATTKKDQAILAKLTELSDTKANADQKVMLYALAALAALGLGFVYLNRKK